MKSRRLLSKLVLTSTFLFASHVSFAKMTSCPSIEDLKKFSGFTIDYPLNLDINTQEALTWLVAQNKINAKKHIMYTLIQSPVKPNEGEYPLDAANKMIDVLEPLINKPECTDDSSICGCAYWNPYDGSLATFLASEFNLNHAPAFASQLKMSAKIMSKFKGMKN